MPKNKRPAPDLSGMLGSDQEGSKKQRLHTKRARKGNSSGNTMVVHAVAAEVEKVAAAAGAATTKAYPAETFTPLDGKAAMQWLLAPLPVERFLQQQFEKQPMHLAREGCQGYFQRCFSSEEVDRILRLEGLKYSTDVEVTRVRGRGCKVLNSNMDGTTDWVDPDTVWARMVEQGCSIMLRHVERLSESVWPLTSALESFWTSPVAFTAELSPSTAQSMAPHYDATDAFILQVEGSKHWTIHAPRSREQVLPRSSSADFLPLYLGKPLLDVVLSPGDLLYLPRGYIYEAKCVHSNHSLHLAVSVNKENTYVDLMERVIPAAIEKTSQESWDLRQALPPDYCSFMGVMHADQEQHPSRKAFLATMNGLVAKVAANVPWDNISDQMSVENYVQKRLPLYNMRHDSRTSCYRRRRAESEDALSCSSRVRLVAKDAARLTLEGDQLVVHHILHNRTRREGDERADQYWGEGDIDFGMEDLEALKALLSAFPEPITLEGWTEDHLDVAQELLDKNIIQRIE